MGTRGTYGFRVGGQDKVSYNHSDSYPAGLGHTMAQFVRSTPTTSLHKIADRLRVIDESEPITPAILQHCRDVGVYTGDPANLRTGDEWYWLLRDAQGDPSYWAKGLSLILDGQSFLADSLMCEWAYIVNVDDRTLEVYRGFNQNPLAPGRYAHLEDGNYNGVALISTTPFAVIQEMDDTRLAQFISDLDTPEGN